MPVAIEDASGKTWIIDKIGIDSDQALYFRDPDSILHTSVALNRFMKEAVKSKYQWFTDNKKRDLILSATMLDRTARIPKDLLDLIKNDSYSIDLYWLKNRIEKDFGFHR